MSDRDENRFEDTESLGNIAPVEETSDTPIASTTDTDVMEATDAEAPDPAGEPSNVADHATTPSEAETGAWRGSYYETKDGRAGYMYMPPYATTDAAPKRKKHLGLKITAIVLAALLVLVGGTVATWTVAQWALDYMLEDFQTGAPTGDGVDTSTDSNEYVAGNGTQAGDTDTAAVDGEEETQSGEPLKQATIVKVEPQRQDSDGDGKLDVETGTEGQVLTSAGKEVYSKATVCNMVLDSVVEITTETVLNTTLQSGAGSGVIIAKEGYIITNNHVIEGSDTITVRLTDGSIYTAELIGRDEQTDIAVIWIDPGDKQLTVATMGASSDLVVGETILACGNPLGALGGTMTEGIVSATERNIRIDGQTMTLLQISAPINPGNSGGGLFNLAGHLVGVVNAKYSAEGVEGLGFAIPIDTACAVAEELIQYGYVRNRPTLGLTLVEVTSSQMALYYFNSRYTGVYVYQSENEQFSYGDRLVSVNGQPVETVSDAQKAIAHLSVGDTVEVVVYRDRENVTIKAVLMEQHPAED